MAEADDVITTEEGAPPAAGVQSPATAPNGAQGAAGAAPADWRGQIPPSLRGEKLWSRHKDLTSVLQSYAEAEKRQGALLAKPGPDATPEQIADFRAKLGVPAKPSDYTPPEPMDGLSMDEARWERWTGHAHKLGLTGEQLSTLARLEAEEHTAALAAAAQEYGRGHDALKQAWGEGPYAQKIQWAERALQRLGAPALQEWLTELGMGKDPGWMRRMDPEWVTTWANVGTLLAEDGYIDGRVTGVSTRDEAQAKINEINAQGKAHPANNPDHPQYAQASAAKAELYKIVHGGR